MVTACIADVSYSGIDVKENLNLQPGDNEITLGEYLSLLIYPKENTIATLTDGYGTKDKAWGEDYYEIYNNGWGSANPPYELNVYDESTYRTSSVTVTMDDFTKVTVVRADGKEFTPGSNTLSVPYNADNESRLTIKPRNYSTVIYKVSADGIEVEKTNGNFVVELVDNDGNAVKNVDVTANFPDDFKCTTTLTLDGPKGMISYISVNGAKLEDISAYLDGEGIVANPGDKVAIGFDADHKVTGVSDNGENKYAYSQYTIERIDCDHNITVSGYAYKTFDVTFNIVCPEGIKASLGYTQLELKEGVNVISFNEKNSNLTISAVSGYNIVTLTDNNGVNYLEKSDWEWYHNAYVTLTEGMEITIEAEKIRRDDVAVLYFSDKFNDIYFSWFSVYFANYDTLPNRFAAGYNLVNFRSEDGMFKCYASGYYDKLYVYRNGQTFPLDYESAQYFEDAGIENNTVYKVFFDEQPTVSTITFTVANGALDGYEIKKDLLTVVDGLSTTAVGTTSFDITPLSENAAPIYVTVNGNSVDAKDGVYSFEVSSDTNVTITSTTGISDIENASPCNADVFNLQGIRVGRNMSAEEIENLPAGLYIINGRKTIVK